MSTRLSHHLSDHPQARHPEATALPITPASLSSDVYTSRHAATEQLSPLDQLMKTCSAEDRQPTAEEMTVILNHSSEQTTAEPIDHAHKSMYELFTFAPVGERTARKRFDAWYAAVGEPAGLDRHLSQQLVNGDISLDDFLTNYDNDAEFESHIIPRQIAYLRSLDH